MSTENREQRMLNDLKLEYVNTKQLLSNLRDSNSEIFKQELRLQKDLHEIHSFAQRFRGKDDLCPIHDRHHGHNTARQPTRKIALEALRALEEPTVIEDIESEMKRQGWVTSSSDPIGVLRATLHRHKDKGFVSKSAGYYSLIRDANTKAPVN